MYKNRSLFQIAKKKTFKGFAHYLTQDLSTKLSIKRNKHPDAKVHSSCSIDFIFQKKTLKQLIETKCDCLKRGDGISGPLRFEWYGKLLTNNFGAYFKRFIFLSWSLGLSQDLTKQI